MDLVYTENKHGEEQWGHNRITGGHNGMNVDGLGVVLQEDDGCWASRGDGDQEVGVKKLGWWGLG